MNENIFALICLAAIGIFFLLIIFVMPQRKLPEEKGMKLLYEERCSATWKYLGGGLVSGSIFPSRISFYEDYFVVSLLGITKINYSEVLSSSFKNNWFSKSMTISLGHGKSLIISSKNIEKIQSIIATKNPKALA